MNMNTSRRAQWLLAAAVAALPAMTIVSSASAQYQAGQNGHALDANTQAGSGGQNAAGPNGSAVSGNQIVTGNSTGGTAFQGHVPYFDPNTFDGPLASRGNDNFVRDSHGVPTAYAPAFSSDTPRAFYSANSLTTAPPAGYVNENFQNAIVGTGLSPSGSSASFASPLDALRAQNLGGTTVYGYAPGTYTNAVTELPPPGTEDSGLYTATPLISTGLFEQASSDNGQSAQFSISQPQLPNLPDRFTNSQLTADQLNNPNQNLTANNAQTDITNQGKLPAQPGPNTGGATGTGANPGPGPNGPNSRNLLNATPLNNTINPTQGGNQQYNENNPLAPSSMLNQQPMNTPLNPNGQQSSSTAMVSSSYNSSLSTGQGAQQWLQVPPAQQSTQYRLLQQRLDEFNAGHPVSDQEAFQQYQQQQMTLKNGGAGANGGAGGNAGGPVGPAPSGGGMGAGPVNPGGPPAPSGSGANPNNPLKPSDLGGARPHITSLADGVRNAELRSLLASAEDLMKQDKFASAIEKYDSAIQLTNNINPLFMLGRANAELGAELYGRAEGDLRRAVAADPAVLMGQYDLPKMMDPKRIDAVRDDLQTLAKDSKAVRPALLLAYLEYNTGNEAAAQKYLADAEKLVGRSDPLVELMRTHWTFMSPQMKSGDANK
jgi:tetratricopeptide (TPR) repeat protein